MAKHLLVELPVCPDCNHVGKIAYGAGLKGFCVGAGSKGTAHKKRRMVPVVFQGSMPGEVAKQFAVADLPFAAHIETATYGGGDHIVVDETVTIGRIHRSPGNALCKARRSFKALLPGGEERTASCKRCIEIAERTAGEVA